MSSGRTQKYDRWEIYGRDAGICQVCKRPIYEIEKLFGLSEGAFYECGHIIDWCISKDDNPANLLCMCKMCNRLKPLHYSEEEFIEWLDNGYWLYAFIEKQNETQSIKDNWNQMVAKYGLKKSIDITLDICTTHVMQNDFGITCDPWKIWGWK